MTCIQCGRSDHEAKDCPINALIVKELRSGTYIIYDRRNDSVVIDFPDGGCDSEAICYGRSNAIKELKQIIRFLESIPKEQRYLKPRKAHQKL